MDDAFFVKAIPPRYLMINSSARPSKLFRILSGPLYVYISRSVGRCVPPVFSSFLKDPERQV